MTEELGRGWTEEVPSTMKELVLHTSEVPNTKELVPEELVPEELVLEEQLLLGELLQ